MDAEEIKFMSSCSGVFFYEYIDMTTLIPLGFVRFDGIILLGFIKMYVNILFIGWFVLFLRNKDFQLMLQLDDCKNKLAKFKQHSGLKYGLIRIGIFGSVARQDNTDKSDIDIVVELEKPSLSLMYDLKENLKKLFGCEVDLVRFRDSLRPILKNNILNEAIYV